MLTVLGGVLFGLFYLIAGIGYILLGGLIPLAIGISLTLFYAITRCGRLKDSEASVLPAPRSDAQTEREE